MKKGTKIDLDVEVIGIPLDECFVCGKGDSTRHHVIAQALKPKKNITIPLCEDHKDLLHPIVKQPYMPKSLRRRISTIKKLSNQLEDSVTALRNDINFTKKNVNSSIHPTLE